MDETFFEYEDRYEWLADDEPRFTMRGPIQTEAVATEVNED